MNHPVLIRNTALGLTLGLLSLAPLRVAADAPEAIRPIAVGLGGFNYWSSGPFANTLLSAFQWLEYTTDWGAAVYFQNEDGTPNPQFNSRGLPKYLNTGKKLRVLMWPYSVHSSSEPADWPKRGMTGYGKWVVTWQGNADIRLNGATFVAAESSGPATGSLVNGRRVYQMSAANPSGHITIEEIKSEITDLKVWLPDPSNPTAQSLENSGQFWHPAFLANIAGMEFGSIRFMDWGQTNASPQQDWSDRRLPNHVFQQGVLNRRSPAPGVVWYTNSSGQPVYFSGNRSTGIAYEYMVQLANQAGRDLWICVPHMATDDYVTKLAQLIRFGSDGVNPYTSPQANPIYPPLNEGLRVWVEYSNEIWSNGDSFPQGNWAEAQAIALGYGGGNAGKAKFNARRSSKIWSIFQQVFGGSQRIVRVGAIWTAQTTYTDPYLAELRDYGPTLSPPVQPDVISPTTYFGNGIQDWAYEQANLNRFNADKSWFHTDQDFVYNTSTGATRPVSKPLSDPYWMSDKLNQDLAATFDEWKKRIFSGSTVGGGGYDTTGEQGGFNASLATTVYNTFGRHVPLVSYEGGPSLYTDYYDGGDVRDDGITNFMIVLNRRPEFEEIYRIQLNMARAKGLACHGLFVDVARAGKWGQWGHLEYPDQPHETAPKWMAVRRWGDDMMRIRNPLFPQGAVPAFVTAGTLPQGVYLQPYSADIVAGGGDVAAGSELEWQVVGSYLAPGLTLGPVAGDPTRYRIQGTPQRGGWSYAYLRVNDDDGDAAWKVFSLYVPGGPGALVESIFTGATSAASLPYTTAQFLDSSRITWSGIVRGAVYQSGGGSAIGTDGTGVRIDPDTDRLMFAVSQGALNESDSTLISAITDNEYLAYTITPQSGQSLDLRNAEFQMVWERVDYHAPRYLAVFSTIGGFANGQQIYTSPRTTAMGSLITVNFRLPETAAYANVTGPVQFRVYFYGSQYAHRARLYSIKLTRDVGNLPPTDPQPPVFGSNPFTRPAATAGVPYTSTLVGTATDPNGDPITWTKLTGPAWLSVAAGGALSGTPSESDIGVNTFTVRAADPGGLSADATFTISVLAAPAAAPIFTPAAGTYAGPVTVALSSATAGASIRYTTDGTTPTSATGTVYTAPFLVSATATVRAIAYKSGLADSSLASATYTISGGSDVGTFLQVGANDIVMEAENFTNQVANGDTKTWAVATTPAGYQGSGLITTSDTGANSPGWGSGCRVDYPVQFSASGGGTYYVWARLYAPNTNGDAALVGVDGNRLGNNDTKAKITASSTGAWKWVRHGTTLTASNSQLRTFNFQRNEDGLSADKFVLTRNSSSSYLSDASNPAESTRSQPPVATVTATPAPGVYAGSVQITLVTGTAGASIRYTTNGTAPTSTTGTLYSGPFTLTSSATVKAIAYKTGAADSAVTSFAYTVQNVSVLAFSASDYTVSETSGQALVRVERLGSASGVTTVNYFTSDGTAAAGQDYTAVSGSLTWADGDTSQKTIAIPILNDAIYYEGEERFTVALSSPVNATLGSPSVASVAILDDDTDAPPTLIRVAPASSPAAAYAHIPLVLQYTVQDDGIEPPALEWSKISGPGDAVFDNPQSASTLVTFSAAGVVAIRLTARDGLHTVHDDITINVALATLTVTFDANGGMAASPASKAVTFGQPYGALATTSRAGYTFAGWFTAPSGGTQVTEATTVTTANNHTLYAQWTALPYTAWVNSQSNWPQGADTSPSGDPDGDGIPNLLEYAFGLSPVSANTGAALLTPGTTVVNDNGQFHTRATITFTPQTKAGLRYYLDATNDLNTTWVSAEITDRVAPGVANTFTDTANLDAPGAKRFLRLRITEE